MTAMDRKVFFCLAVLFCWCALLFICGAACVAIANYAVTFPSSSWMRGLLVGCSIVPALYILMTTILGLAYAYRKMDGVRQLLASRWTYVAIFVLMPAVIVLIGSVFSHFFRAMAPLPDQTFEIGDRAGSYMAIAASYVLLTGLVFYAALIIRYVLAALRNVMEYSLILSFVGSAAMMGVCCIFFAAATQVLFVSPENTPLFSDRAIWLSSPWPPKSEALKRAIVLRHANIARYSLNRASFDPIVLYARKHKDAFVVQGRTSARPDFSQLVWFYADTALRVTTLNLPDVNGYRVTNIVRQGRCVGAGLLVWAFELLIALLFAPVVYRTIIKFFGPPKAAQ
jgi:hypothetical protein